MRTTQDDNRLSALESITTLGVSAVCLWYGPQWLWHATSQWHIWLQLLVVASGPSLWFWAIWRSAWAMRAVLVITCWVYLHFAGEALDKMPFNILR